jgi:hypothetical protein
MDKGPFAVSQFVQISLVKNDSSAAHWRWRSSAFAMSQKCGCSAQYARCREESRGCISRMEGLLVDESLGFLGLVLGVTLDEYFAKLLYEFRTIFDGMVLTA